jgi:hypothetical protein
MKKLHPDHFLAGAIAIAYNALYSSANKSPPLSVLYLLAEFQTEHGAKSSKLEVQRHVYGEGRTRLFLPAACSCSSFYGFFLGVAVPPVVAQTNLLFSDDFGGDQMVFFC